MSGPERKNIVCLPDAPGQGIPLGRGDISEGSLAVSLCFTVFGAGIARNDLPANQRERDGVHGGMSTEREWHVFMD